MFNNLMEPIEKLIAVKEDKINFFKKLIHGDNLFHLLCHLPTNVMKRTHVETLQPEDEDQLVTFHFLTAQHIKGHAKSAPYRIRGVIIPGQKPVELIFFNGRESYLKRMAPLEEVICVSGKVKCKKMGSSHLFQIAHPDHMGIQSSLNYWVGPERIYKLTYGLTQGMVRDAINEALENFPPVAEWLDVETLQRFKFPCFQKALQTVHFPKSVLDLSPLTPARLRLVFDELFAKQLAQQYFKAQTQLPPVLLSPPHMQCIEEFLTTLPFRLTGDQQRTIREIAHDLQKNVPMHRLLQGDVGSGKTIVALLAALMVIESEGQAAFLAPTEILARQHFATLQELLKDTNIHVVLLTGREKGMLRVAILNQIASGAANLIIGTHAIFQDTVIYARLALAIIDEQHRFGVKQRLQLAYKSHMTHILSMTATPIPRTLLLSHHGEMEVSFLKEKPPGRIPIETRTVSLKRLDEVIDFVAKKIEKNEKIFWVCPLIEESETLDLAAVEERFKFLNKRFARKVVLTHGKQTSDEKDKAMHAFAHGDANILVATTVIEVGVNIPAATVMIIENAQKFGLAQLHQLRGRIGRGTLPSVCLLLFDDKLTFTAKQRLMMMKKSDDGFVLAEEDLRLRGGGDVMGVRQSGLPKFYFAEFETEDDEVYKAHLHIYEMANIEATKLIEQDPKLESKRGQEAKKVIELFGYNETLKLKQAG